MSLVLTRRHNVDRFGYLIPTRYGNVPMVGAVGTYRPGEGRFGGAVAVEEGTTNLIANPTGAGGSGSTFPSGWSAQDDAGLATHSFQPDQQFSGLIADVISVNNARSSNMSGRLFFMPTGSRGIPVTEGEQLTVSVYLELLDGVLSSNLGIGVHYYNSSGAYLTEATVHITPDKVSRNRRRFAGTVTVPAGAAYAQPRLTYYQVPPGTRLTLLVVAPQAEKKPFATSFVAGTRAAGKLTYPVSVLPVPAGTLSLWVYFPDLSIMTSFASIVGTHSVAAPGCFFLRRTGSYLGVVVGDDSGSTKEIQAPYPSVGWHHVTVVWGSGTIRLYLDGIQVSSGSATLPSTWRGSLGIGARPDGSHPWNGLLDELLILPYAASEEEIRAWYEADGPIPPHPAALLQWDWQAVRPATMVVL